MLDKTAQRLRKIALKVRNLTLVNCAIFLKLRNSRLKTAQITAQLSENTAESLSLPIYRERDSERRLTLGGEVAG